MEGELKEVLVKYFGTRIESDYETILKCISAIITARVYAGNQGDNPLCVLNRALEAIVNK